MPAESMETIVALCKRRGFLFPSSTLYGGMQGLYDYGPMGVELKKNLQKSDSEKDNVTKLLTDLYDKAEKVVKKDVAMHTNLQKEVVNQEIA